MVKQDPDISPSLRDTIRKSLGQSEVIVGDISYHMSKISPKPGENSVTFGRRVNIFGLRMLLKSMRG
jgi:hypothetical protein